MYGATIRIIVPVLVIIKNKKNLMIWFPNEGFNNFSFVPKHS